MAYPTEYERSYDFQSYQNANPTRPLPADKLNAELNSVETSIGEIVAFIQSLAAADGSLLASAVTLTSYTVATLPSASSNARKLIYVSDETGGAVPAFSDGTNWRRVTDREIVS